MGKSLGRIRSLAASAALALLLAGVMIPAASATDPPGPEPTQTASASAPATVDAPAPTLTATASPAPEPTEPAKLPLAPSPSAEEVPAAETTAEPTAVPETSTSPEPAQTATTEAGPFPGPPYAADFEALAAQHSLGQPKGPINCGLTGGGCQQDFAVASIYRTPAGNFRVVAEPIRSTYWAAAGQGGPLGYPAGDQRCGLARGACAQAFDGGVIYITPTTGTHALTGSVHATWLAGGGEYSELGYPTTGIRCGLIGGGCQQDFQGGSAYVTPSAGTFAVVGSVRGVYWAKAGQGGALGYPTTDKHCDLFAGGCQQDFQGGTIYVTPQGGTFAVQGALRAAYWAADGQGGALGYPKANHNCGLVGGGCQQDFERGTLYLTPASGTLAVLDPIRPSYWAKGGQGGALGYPTSEQRCGLAGGGCIQDFQGGSIYLPPTGGVFAVQGSIRSTYWAAGGHTSNLGYPTGDHVCGLPGNGCQQNFQTGTVSLTGSSAAVASPNPFSARWLELGGVFGYLGYPVGAAQCGFSNDGCKQPFQAGAVVSSGAGVHGVGGPIAITWAANGAQDGRYGYPTAAQTCSGGHCSQSFQGGVISTGPVLFEQYSGVGSTVLRINKPGGAALAGVAALKHEGTGNFIVWSLDGSLQKLDLVANEIGAYGGTVLFDEWNDEGVETVYLEIQADGPWTITVSGVATVPRFDGSFEVVGKGDAVLLYTGHSRPGTLVNNGSSNFIIWAYGQYETDLVVNEIGPYSGVVPLLGPAFYEVTSNGTWSILMH